MKLVNIIHPYTYRLKGDNLILGPDESFLERDQRVADFISMAWDKGVRTVHHNHVHPETLQGGLASMAFIASPLEPVFLDNRMEWIVTTQYGTPLPDERPLSVSAEEWERAKRQYSTHSKMGEMLRGSTHTFFIGGVLEACMGNMARYYNEYLRAAGERVLYVPELCVSFDKEKRKATKRDLAKRSIEAVSQKEAMALFVE